MIASCFKLYLVHCRCLLLPVFTPLRHGTDYFFWVIFMFTWQWCPTSLFKCGTELWDMIFQVKEYINIEPKILLLRIYCIQHFLSFKGLKYLLKVILSIWRGLKLPQYYQINQSGRDLFRLEQVMVFARGVHKVVGLLGYLFFLTFLHLSN